MLFCVTSEMNKTVYNYRNVTHVHYHDHQYWINWQIALIVLSILIAGAIGLGIGIALSRRKRRLETTIQENFALNESDQND